MHSRWIINYLIVGSLTGIFGGCLVFAADPAEPTISKRLVAIDNVCAWPNLTKMPDGTIVATIFNKPSHGLMEGDVECWSTVDGLAWQKRGTAAPHEAGTNRMNVAAGATRDGQLIVLASGWSLESGKLVQPQAAWACHSTDGGKTWSIHKEKVLPPRPEGFTVLIPFGDIVLGADGRLRTACYARDAAKRDHVWMLGSNDGKTWEVVGKISDRHNETALFHLGKGRWLAAARSLEDTRQRLDLIRSEDDGKTWSEPMQLADVMHHPAHLLRLADGRLLLTYGVRTPKRHGVSVKLSSDDGKTWSAEQRLIGDLTSYDCGYPSTVELGPGKLLTAYYAAGAPKQPRYHMGVLLWSPPSKP